MTSLAAPRPISLSLPVALSAALHAGAIAALLFVREVPHAPAPPMYRVNLIAAPPSPKPAVVQPDVLQPAVSTAAPAPKKAPAAAKAKVPAPPVKTAVKPVKTSVTPGQAATPQAATPSPTTAAGKGTDIANVRTDGIVFPYQEYLERIVRNIALQFKPSVRGALQAEVTFLIRRDGSVVGVQLKKRSGVFSFDQDALAAVELASKSFGPLPAGFSDDVLPVIFSFDPRLLR